MPGGGTLPRAVDHLRPGQPGYLPALLQPRGNPLPGLVVEVGGVVGQHIGEYRIHFRIGAHRGKILGSQHPVHDGLSPELSAVFGQQLFDGGHPFGRPVEICSQECAGNQADNLGQVVVAGVVKGFGIEPFFLVDVLENLLVILLLGISMDGSTQNRENEQPENFS